MECTVNIRELREKQPVFLNIGDPRSLMLPIDGKLTWTGRDRSWIACPPSEGSRNIIYGVGRVSARIECVNGRQFKYVHNNQVFDITQVECASRVTGNERTELNRQCPRTSKAIGFNVPLENGRFQFFNLFNLCIDESSASTLYTRHTLYGKEIDHKYPSPSNRPDFKSAGFPRTIPGPSTAYTQEYQQRRLTGLFQSAVDVLPQRSADEYFNSRTTRDSNFLQRGHLTPDGDELFSTWQWSTYFYLNVAGMWRSINNGNWKHLENNVRTLAGKAKVNLEVFTGTYGTLSPKSISGRRVDFTLGNNGRIPVPKWLWKIVKSPDLDAAIALVVSNNPVDAADPICNSFVGETYGWDATISSDRVDGVVSYCSVQDLRDVVGNIPQEAMAPAILAFDVLQS